MRRKSDLPNQRTPATPIKQTSRHIRKNMNTPSRMPNRNGAAYTDSPFYTPSRYVNDLSDSSPTKQTLDIPFDYKINEQSNNIYFVTIKNRHYVVKKCEYIELSIYRKLNNLKVDLNELFIENNFIMPTFISSMYIIMPYCTGLDKLMYAYDDFPLPLAEKITKQLFHAVALLHSFDILHGDIKPQNILIYDAFIPVKCSQPMEINRPYLNRVYLADFSVSQLKPFTMMEYGDPLYYPPECPQLTTLKADVFSAGLVVYEMLENIIIPQNGEVLYNLVRTNQFKFSNDHPVLKTIIVNCCEMNVNKRWTSQQVIEFLKNEE